MFIQQLSVFLENNTGTLQAMTELLGKGGIDLLALSLADTQSFGIVRMIIHSDQMDHAMKILKENGYIAKINEVICAEVPDRPMGLSELLELIQRAGLSVEYMYSFLRASVPGTAHLILRLDDSGKAEQIFDIHNIKMLGQEEVDAL